MKNHIKVDGRLFQTNKTFSMLKERQKTKIADWMYEAYKKYSGKKDFDELVVTEVLSKIEEAQIWIPYCEIYEYYAKKKSRLESRLQKEIENFK